MKTEIMEAITSKLGKIGIKVIANQTTDIQIDTEFLDAKWSTGEKKIGFHALAYLNESENTIYYWQMTKEVGGGFSFGSDMESSFQTGNTLFRKVKSTGYGVDGKAFEYTIDLGEITSIFKNTAKENNWKMKTVLNKSKAMYSNSKNENPVFSANRPVSNLESEIVSQNNVINKSIDVKENNPNDNENSIKNEKKKMKPIFKIPFISFSVIFALFLLILKVGLFGWFIFLIPFLLIYFMREKFSKFSILKNIILWVITFILLFILLAIISPTSRSSKETIQIPINNTSKITNSESTNQSNSKNINSSDSPYSLISYIVTALPGYDEVGTNMAGEAFKVNPELIYLMHFGISYDINNNDKMPISIKVVDTNVISKPKIGKYSLVAAADGVMDNRDLYISKYQLKNGEYQYDKDLFGSTIGSSFYTVSLALWIYDTKDYIYPIDTKSISSSTVITDAGYTSDDVRSKVHTKIEIKAKDGTTYYMPLDIELLGGNFLENNQLTSSKNFNQEEYINFFKK